tara:strand:+ start:563 stop:1273 length:711 start_codon:yes stop_codon:yes gene_type:complete
MREVVLDTETTGLDFSTGDKIVEIGIIELDNHVPTGKYFHHYLNPERESSLQALKVHRLTNEFLKNKPKFIDIADQFIEFIADSKIVIHNASFDIGFINTELRQCDFDELNKSYIIDTLSLAKNKFPGQAVSLDSLCRKFNIDISDREIHGALKDAKLLANVYLELLGGKQTKLEFSNELSITNVNEDEPSVNVNRFYNKKEIRVRRNTFLNNDDYILHKKSLKEIANNIWEKIEN